MKAVRQIWFLLLLLLFATAFQLPAQQTDADRKLFEDTKAKGENGDAIAQDTLGTWYYTGTSVSKNYAEAVKWWRKAAEQGNASGQYGLGICYWNGNGVSKDTTEAAKWYRKSAEQGNANGQWGLAGCYDYDDGKGVKKNFVEAAKWLRKAAEQGQADAQNLLGLHYYMGKGVIKDYVEAYKWINLSASQGNKIAEKSLGHLEKELSGEQIAEAQRLSREFKQRKTSILNKEVLSSGSATSQPKISGTGFFITDDGYLITNEHVVKDAAQVRLVTSAGLISARVVKVDAANDLALLKAEGKFSSLPIAPSRAVKLGGTVATVGFPNLGLQGFAPKFARGEIASLSGAGDDARYFQISVPVQPGNSGGALVDERGNVVGVVSAKLNAAAALAASGSLPENVNYAVKSSYLLSFLESVPDVSAKLKEANVKEIKFEEVVERAKQAAVLVLVY